MDDYKKHYIRMEDVNTDWYNALPLGNGRMGAMVYRRETELHIALNHYDIYYALLGDGSVKTDSSRQLMERVLQEPVEYRSHYTETRAPRPADFRPIYEGTTQPYCGEIVIYMKQDAGIANSLLELIIEEAVVQWSGCIDEMPFHFDIYIPKMEDRLVVQCQSPAGFIEKVEVQLPLQEMDPASERQVQVESADCGIVEARGENLRYEIMLYCEGGTRCESGTDRLWISGDTIQRIGVSLGQEKQQKNRHVKVPEPYGIGWKAFFSRSRIHLPDSFLETVYYLQLYLMEASSGRGSRYVRQACGLNGLWDIRRPTLWGSMWYWDVNIQSAFAPVFVTNQLELAQDFCQAYLQYEEQARKFAADLYGIDGWALDYPHAFYNCIQPWCVQFLYRYYEYTLDENFLQKQLYPVMNSLFAFLEKRVTERTDGTMAIEPDISPEQGPLAINSVITISTIRYFLEKYILVLKKMGKETASVEKWLRMLPAYAMTQDGQRYKDSERAPDALWLRHPSILMPIYPAEEIHADSDRKTYMHWLRTLDYVQDHCEIGVFGFEWIAAAAARMGEGSAALRILYEKGLDYILHTNGIAYEETDRWVNYCAVTKPPLFLPGMMEPTGGIVAAVCEMLLQDRDGVIHVFPAVPDGQDSLLKRTGYIEEEADHYKKPEIWRDVSFYNLRSAQGCLVSAVMKQGKITGIRLEALRSGCFTLYIPEALSKEVHKTGIGSWTLKAGDIYEIGLLQEAGQAECRQVQCYEAVKTHRRVYLGENRHTAFHKTLDAWLCAYGMGNHQQMSYMMPYKFDFGNVQTQKKYDTVSHRQVSVTEWADLYYGGWIRLDGTQADRISYGFSEKDPDMQVVQRPELDALRGDFLTGRQPVVFDIRVPGGKYELLIISGDEADTTRGRFTILNNRLSVEIHELAGKYAMEEMAVVMKQEGRIRLRIEAIDDKNWKINGLLLRKERSFY